MSLFGGSIGLGFRAGRNTTLPTNGIMLVVDSTGVVSGSLSAGDYTSYDPIIRDILFSDPSTARTPAAARTLALASARLNKTACVGNAETVVFYSTAATSGDLTKACTFLGSTYTPLVEVFGFDANAAETLAGTWKTKSDTDKIYIDWGDDTSNSYAGTSDQAWTHTYATANHRCTVKAVDGSVLTSIYQSNTSSHLGGALSFGSGVTYINLYGHLNTFNGTLVFPAGVTYIKIAGHSNAFNGPLVFPDGVTTIILYGNSNAFNGTLVFPAGVTYIDLNGHSNTFTGTLVFPASATLIILNGNLNAFNGYTRRTPENGQRYFYINGNSMSLSSSDVDNIIIDSALATWENEKVMIITGNAPARTSASDTAYNSLVAQGVTLTLNT